MSPIISASGVGKTFRQLKRQSGFGGAIRSLFSRDYAEIRAVDGISFAIKPGEAVGYLGPNGAGKSTMIKMMTGILTPSAGTLSVFGREPHANRMVNAREIGVVFGQRSQLWWDLPVSEGFDLLADIYRVEPARYRANRDELVALLRLERVLDQPVRQLSLGQRMRAEIAAALLHEPDILFLDEPTIGLDAPSKLAVREVVRRLNRERGVTVLLTTHDMHDIEALAQRVIVIGHGQVLADSPFEALRANVLAERRLVIDFAHDAPEITMAGVEIRSRQGQTLELAFDPAQTPTPNLIGAIAAAHEVVDIHVGEPAIEEVIARFYDLHGAGEA